MSPAFHSCLIELTARRTRGFCRWSSFCIEDRAIPSSRPYPRVSHTLEASCPGHLGTQERQAWCSRKNKERLLLSCCLRQHGDHVRCVMDSIGMNNHHGGEEKEERMSISGTKACPFPKQLCQDMLSGCCSTCLELELVMDI